MKILHVWDQAGVACVLGVGQSQQGHEVTVVKRIGFDPYGILDHYETAGYPGRFFMVRLRAYSAAHFMRKVMRLIEGDTYDLIHVHDLYGLIPRIRVKFPQIKIVMHYHGTVLRTVQPTYRKKHDGDADLILVSTPDLLQYVDHAVYLPNPVDTEHFAPVGPDKGKGVWLGRHGDWPQVADLLNDMLFMPAYDRVFCDRHPVLYSDMPVFLSGYGFYMDLKPVQGKIPAVMSLTALQALSMGLQVYDSNGFWYHNLPADHKPKLVLEVLGRLLSNV